MVYQCSWGTWGMGSWGFGGIISTLLLVGIVILVFLWIIKLWKDMQRRSK